MRHRRFRRGVTLTELMVGVFVLGLAVVVASALFPFSNVLRDKSGDYSRASALLSRKLEQVRSLEAERLNRTNLVTNGIINADSANANGATTHEWSFTTVDQVPQELANGTGTLRLSGIGSDLVRADVTLTWRGLRNEQLQITGMTFVTSKTVWREP